MTRPYLFFYIGVVKSCETKDQFESACRWIRNQLVRLPNPVFDCSYNVEQAKLMPLYRVMVEKASEFGTSASLYFGHEVYYE